MGMTLIVSAMRSPVSSQGSSILVFQVDAHWPFPQFLWALPQPLHGVCQSVSLALLDVLPQDGLQQSDDFYKRYFATSV